MEPRAVEALHDDGEWLPGTLTAWRNTTTGWVGHVRYSQREPGRPDTGLQWQRWLPAARIRPRVSGTVDP